MTSFVGVFVRKKVWLENSLSLLSSGYFEAKPFPIQIPQHFSKLVIFHTYLLMKMEQTERSET
jgi:hypothetical protein